MIRYHDAIARLLGVVSPLPAERCAAIDAPGCVLAAPVRSPIALPSLAEGFEPGAGDRELDLSQLRYHVKVYADVFSSLEPMLKG